MGTSASPINASTATLILAYGQTAGQYGLTINNGGSFTVYGSTRSPYAIATSSAIVGATSIQVPASGVTGWAVGDSITISRTESSGASATEQRTISSITPGSPTTVAWTSGLSYTHIATNTIVVADLTHNVLVESSGTAASNQSYILSLVQNTTSFALTYGQFAYLNYPQSIPGYAGIMLYGTGTTGSISSSTIQNAGTYGIYLYQSTGTLIQGNNLYANNFGYGNYQSNNTLFQSNNIYASAPNIGLVLGDAGGSQYVGNYLSDDANAAVYFNGLTNILFSSNTLSAPGSNGMQTQGSNYIFNSTISWNTVHQSGAYGMWLTHCSGNVVTGNQVSQNGADGIRLDTDTGYQINNNQVYANGGANNYTYNGISILNSSSMTFSNNIAYSNQGYGFYLSNSSGMISTNDDFGYNAGLSSKPDTTAEIFIDSTVAASQLTMYADQVNPSVGVSAAGFSQTAAYLISYNQNFGTGTVRIYGDYAVSGSTLTLDYGVATYTGSGDAGSQKALYFGAANPSFNHGRSRINVASGAGFHAVGVSTAPTTVTMLTSGGTYYTFVDSGAFTLQYASMTNMDTNPESSCTAPDRSLSMTPPLTTPATGWCRPRP